MQIGDWLCAGLSGLLITGCAGMESVGESEIRAALAPMGKLRVAFISAPMFATKDPATGELKGVAVDLGKDLAKRVGVPFEPVSYSSASALLGDGKTGAWDVAVMGINAERATVVDFSAPFMEAEQGYLVRAGAAIAAASDVDKSGVRVGVLQKSGADTYLSRELKNAVLVRAASLAELYALLGSGKADVIAASKSSLFVATEKQPGSRVLDGRILVEPMGMGVPKGRDTAAAVYVGKFVEEVKAGGLVKSAIERAGLRGVVVAPLK